MHVGQGLACCLYCFLYTFSLSGVPGLLQPDSHSPRYASQIRLRAII